MPIKLISWLVPVILLILPSVCAFAGNDGRSARVLRECHKISKKLESISVRDCLNRVLEDSGAYSINGKAILIKDYPPRVNRKPHAAIMPSRRNVSRMWSDLVRWLKGNTFQGQNDTVVSIV